MGARNEDGSYKSIKKVKNSDLVDNTDKKVVKVSAKDKKSDILESISPVGKLVQLIVESLEEEEGFNAKYKRKRAHRERRKCRRRAKARDEGKGETAPRTELADGDRDNSTDGKGDDSSKGDEVKHQSAFAKAPKARPSRKRLPVIQDSSDNNYNEAESALGAYMATASNSHAVWMAPSSSSDLSSSPHDPYTPGSASFDSRTPFAPSTSSAWLFSATGMNPLPPFSAGSNSLSAAGPSQAIGQLAQDTSSSSGKLSKFESWDGSDDVSMEEKSSSFHRSTTTSSRK